MGRSPCCDESGLKKGPWTPEEDQKLVHHIQKHGHGSWRALPKLAGLNRCGKSCRLRWTNYLRPDIKRGKFSQEEEQTILHLHSILGNKWSAIATHLPGRTDNEIKNFWNTHLKKKLIQMGFDPMTHQPRTDLVSTLPYLIALASMMDTSSSSIDEHALSLQAEAIQMAKLQYLHYLLQSSSSNSNLAFDHNNPINITNMEPPFSLLNVKENINTNNNNNNNGPSSFPPPHHHHGNGILIDDDSSCQPLHYHPNMLLSHFLDPPSQQVSFNSQSCLNNINEQGQGSTTNYAIISQMDHTTADDNSSWIVPSSTSPLSSIAPNNNGPSTTTSNNNNNNNNPGDTSSTTSSYGGPASSSSSYWSELFLVDPTIMHELP
ncbi:hypothetical protein AHAS_Ahas17G0290400 [Arachis hypogaea]